eukprot:TRINITY_DN32903_c0_g1_i1.p1 TRINITY_DN32903_c0_g1~~TRINITY_DN32903_c0_g1_i1.p1  ORF type:complete len:418 (+),score=-0.32 TRINITY_DN32903_c0_g1_i1:56-1309(+)
MQHTGIPSPLAAAHFTAAGVPVFDRTHPTYTLPALHSAHHASLNTRTPYIHPVPLSIPHRPAIFSPATPPNADVTPGTVPHMLPPSEFAKRAAVRRKQELKKAASVRRAKRRAFVRRMHPRLVSAGACIGAACRIFILVFVLLPIVCCAVAAPLGGLVADAEGWEYADGFFYVAAILTAQPDPLSAESVNTHHGRILLVFVGAWALGIFAVFIVLLSAPFTGPIIRLFRLHRNESNGVYWLVERFAHNRHAVAVGSVPALSRPAQNPTARSMCDSMRYSTAAHGPRGRAVAVGAHPRCPAIPATGAASPCLLSANTGAPDRLGACGLRAASAPQRLRMPPLNVMHDARRFGTDYACTTASPGVWRATSSDEACTCSCCVMWRERWRRMARRLRRLAASNHLVAADPGLSDASSSLTL